MRGFALRPLVSTAREIFRRLTLEVIASAMAMGGGTLALLGYASAVEVSALTWPVASASLLCAETIGSLALTLVGLVSLLAITSAVRCLVEAVGLDPRSSCIVEFPSSSVPASGAPCVCVLAGDLKSRSLEA